MRSFARTVSKSSDASRKRKGRDAHTKGGTTVSMPEAAMAPDDGPYYACEGCGAMILAPAALCADCEDELNDDDEEEVTA